MEHRDNPYTPGAGTTPPALTGRSAELGRFEVLLERLERRRPEQSQIITGLRGVGKTVLLNSFRNTAESRGWATVEAEIDSRTSLGPLMTRLGRQALYRIDAPKRWGDRARRAAGVLRSFTLTVDPSGAVTIGASNEVEPVSGFGDSGVLSDDLTELFLALGEAAAEKGIGVVFLLDEVQFLGREDLEALILAVHKCSQRTMPVTLVAAGLPQIPRLAGEAKSYAERLFKFPAIGRLPEADAHAALSDPADKLGVTFRPDALDLAYAYTEGYPYFLQEVGSAAWETGDDNLITKDDVESAIGQVETELDQSFFRVRVERCTDLELAYLRAMAELGPDAQKSGDIAVCLGYERSEQLGPTKAGLINKGLLYTPGHGLAAYTVPQFDRFMRRYMDFERRTPRRRQPRR